MKTRKSHFQH